MKPIQAVVVPRVRALAHLNDVPAVLGHDDRGHAVLPDERGIVADRQLEPSCVENGHVRVEQGDAQPHAFDLGGKPLALVRFDHEVINIFTPGDTVDRDIERDRLGLVEVVVWLDLGDFGKRSDAEAP